MQLDAEILILGGGCAGLSLARELARSGEQSPSTLILEQRGSYHDDRTWCFWDTVDCPRAALVHHRWRHMRLTSGQRQIDLDCADTPYQMIRASAFYQQALCAIEAAKKIRLETEIVTLSAPRRINGYWEVDTNAGKRRAAKVIDTRPDAGLHAHDALLWQSFLGQEIECTEAVFDPARAVLMDFMNGDGTSVDFTYVLPISPHRALIEVTTFARDRIAAEAMAASLREQITKRTGMTAFTVLRSEHGILPMGLRRAIEPATDNMVHVGVTHGGARPASGYAFQRIQRWASACAEQLVQGQAPIGHTADPPLQRAMDHLFLSLIRARPAIAPALFMHLFGNADQAQVIRFLTDRGSLRDVLGVVLALPAWPFLAQLGRSLIAPR